MPEDAVALFREFRARWLAGNWPDATDYLERAGGEADDLALMLELFLSRPLPAPAPDEARVYIDALARGESPLLELRRRRGIRREAVEDFLLERFQLDPGRRARLKRRYHELESGLLEPERLSGRLIEALSELFAANVRSLVTWRPPELRAEPAYFRAAAAPAASVPPSPVPDDEEDEIDRLFLGGAATEKEE